VTLSAFGEKKFETSGEYFQQLGREYDSQTERDGGSSCISFSRLFRGNPEVILIASGSEVSVAVQAHESLMTQGIRSRVVSMA
jgi:transketolase